MNQLDINRQRAQLLTAARNLLNEEYKQSRSEQYTKWQTESNHLWISKGIILPYPSSFGYPTEEEVVTRALQLYNIQNNKMPAGVELPKTDDSMTSSVTAKLMEASQPAKQIVLPDVPEVTPWEQYLAPTPLVESIPEEPVISEPIVESEPLIEDVVAKEEIEEETEEPMTEEEVIEEAKRNSNLRILLAKFITMAKSLDAKAKKDEGTPI